jgi:hypothetical protein
MAAILNRSKAHILTFKYDLYFEQPMAAIFIDLNAHIRTL